MITPVQMTQGPCNHYLMLQQSFQLFTTEDSCATLQPGSEPETTGAHGRRQSVLFSRDFLPGSISRASISTSGSWNTATLPERLSEWKWKVPFPHVRILKEMVTIRVFIFVTLANGFHYCLLPVPKRLQLILPQALKQKWKSWFFRSSCGQQSRLSFLV